MASRKPSFTVAARPLALAPVTRPAARGFVGGPADTMACTAGVAVTHWELL